VNEKELVEEFLARVLGECIVVELLATDSQFESQVVFDLLESLKVGHTSPRLWFLGYGMTIRHS